MHYLKYLFDESDELVVEKFIENPDWQFFCGCEDFEHELPFDPTSLVKWHQRIGPEAMEKLLTERLPTAKRERALKESEIKRVCVDDRAGEGHRVSHICAPVAQSRPRLSACGPGGGLQLRANLGAFKQARLETAGALSSCQANEASAARNQALAALSRKGAA